MKKEELELIDYSLYFATKAHAGQKRKSEPDLDMIFHPFTVGMILQRAGANTNCVIAGILHDVVEDTKYTLEDINKIKTASMEGKLVECADKISNLETLYALYKEEGEKVWESFNKPKEVQKWYYTSMYDAVLMNATEENKLFERYKKILNKLF